MTVIMEGFLYVLENFKLALKWEVSKFKFRGIHNLTALFLLYLHLSYVPEIIYFLYRYLPYQNRHLTYAIGSWTTHLVTISIFHCVYAFIYYIKNPYLDSFKSNSDKWPWEQKEWPATKRKIIVSLLLQNCLIIPLMLLTTGLTAKYENTDRLPTFSEFIPQFVIFQIIGDIWGYFSHRAFHVGSLYKNFHKFHHDFNVSITVSAEYTHPFEFVFGNIVSLNIGPFLYGQSHVHLITFFTWITIRISNSIETHSGYTFPWTPTLVIPFAMNEDYHDFHHNKNIGTYSAYLVVMDVIFGNHRKYLEYRGITSKKAR